MSHQPPAPDHPTRAAAQPRWLNRRIVGIGWLVICTLALIVFVVRSADRSPDPSIDRADPTNAELVAQGQQLYATRCAGCHGGDLTGQQGWPQRRADGTLPATPLDMSGTAWQRDDGWLFTTIKAGGQATASPGTVSTMPAFGGNLSDQQIWAVVSYLKSMWPSGSQPAQSVAPN